MPGGRYLLLDLCRYNKNVRLCASPLWGWPVAPFPNPFSRTLPIEIFCVPNNIVEGKQLFEIRILEGDHCQERRLGMIGRISNLFMEFWIPGVLGSRDSNSFARFLASYLPPGHGMDHPQLGRVSCELLPNALLA